MTKEALFSPGYGARAATLPTLVQESQVGGVVGECEIEMDKSVLEFGRPGLSTESLPAHSPQLGYTAPTVTTGTIRAANRSPSERLSPSSPKFEPQQFPPSELQASRPAPSPPMCLSGSPPRTSQQASKPSPQRSPRKRAVSNTSPNSVFRLLPRETRPALRRMLCFDPKARTTMGQLLYGRCGGGGFIALEEGDKCGCERDRDTEESNGDDCDEDDQDSDEEYDDDHGDSWVTDIDTCTEQEVPTHVHVRIAADEKNSKRLFF